MPIARPTAVSVTILSGQSLSDVADLGVGTVVGIQCPPITNAALTFQGSDDGVTFKDLKDAGAVEVQIAASTGDRFVQAPSALKAAVFLKIRSGTSATPVAQGADRVFRVVVKK
jgi:hypothetical protein